MGGGKGKGMKKREGERGRRKDMGMEELSLWMMFTKFRTVSEI